jgi:Flp pilus assembly CpaF family ATPase
VQGHPSQKPSESQARRATALKSALGPLMELLTDDLVVEIMLNADGAVWVSSAIECTRRRTPQARPWSYGGPSSRKRG